MENILSSQLFCVLFGAVIALASALIQNKRNFVSSLDSEISKERIAAYKNIYNTVCKLKHNISPEEKINIPSDCFLGTLNGANDEYKASYSFPTIFYSFDSLNEYKHEISMVLNNNRLFLHQSLLNKVSFLDSYLSKIWYLSHGKSDNYLHMVGFTLNNEISKMIDDIDKEIQYFYNHGKTQKNKVLFSRVYDYEYAHYHETDLYSIFMKNHNAEKFGDFQLCENCKAQDDCPLNEKTSVKLIE